jgi:ADP-ribosylglycohydrolase
MSTEPSNTCTTPVDLYEHFYHEFLVTFPPWDSVFTLEMVPCALAICAIVGEDTGQAIIGATNVGRDADTIAGIAGELAGALYGIDALPTQWVNRVIEVNPSPDLEQMAKNWNRAAYVVFGNRV